ncbi:MBL fold metallo-hydrolase [Saccharopolyspora shandongensis]|uniref:Glyoxylase, beta-lactamase superfamily II n=1 Tax=Saccharopolyspora shandongensis TaxID=418495 RepID=A0A1H3HFS9_9PSEU|nr:MBL fold metallo-hydrolase [Saccharopolyspora shandongensis]SDY14312.1 Glyoxylase, beta-lactamase superfamily II [Saccharopolyspora shandongensis]
MNDAQRWNAVAGIRSIDLGDLRVSYVPDGVVGLKPRGWFPETTEADWREHARHLDESGQLVASIGGLLVERGSRAMLIDAGYGPAGSPDDPANPVIGAIHGRDLLDNLAALGREPDEIEAVAITHLHTDHIGWAHHGAFPKARVLLSEREWERRDQHAADVTEEMLDRLGEQVETIHDGQEVFPGVRVWTTFGHTPGHASYTISSGGRRLIVLGDALHSAVQIENPTWPVWADVDRDAAIRSRQGLLRELREPNTIGFGIHFADVQFGRVTEGPTPTWTPLP